jgi:hypothetical protein
MAICSSHSEGKVTKQDLEFTVATMKKIDFSKDNNQRAMKDL